MIVMHCQPFWQSNSHDQRKLRNHFGLHGRNWGLSVPKSTNNTDFFQIFHSVTPAQIFPSLNLMTGISSEHLFCLSCWEGNTGATYIGLKSLLNKDSCKTYNVFLCPFLELKFIGLYSVDGVLVEVKSSRSKPGQQDLPSNLVSIFLLSWIWIDSTLVHLLLWCM